MLAHDPNNLQTPIINYLKFGRSTMHSRALRTITYLWNEEIQVVLTANIDLPPSQEDTIPSMQGQYLCVTVNHEIALQWCPHLHNIIIIDENVW